MDTSNEYKSFVIKLDQMVGEFNIMEGNIEVKLGQYLIEKGQNLISKGLKDIQKGTAKKNKYSNHVSDADTKKGGDSYYEPSHDADYSSQNPQLLRFATNKENILILFVKADAGESLVQSIISMKKLSLDLQEDLYLNTANIWVGSKSDYEMEFDRYFGFSEKRGFVAALDFYMLKLTVPSSISIGFMKGKESMERLNAFEAICTKEIAVDSISKRLNFNELSNSDLIWDK